MENSRMKGKVDVKASVKIILQRLEERKTTPDQARSGLHDLIALAETIEELDLARKAYAGIRNNGN